MAHGSEWQRKKIGYLLLGHICFAGPGLGQSRAVSKKHVVTNAAAVAHRRNGRKNKTGKDLACKSPVLCKFLGNSFDRRSVQLTGLEPWL